MSHSIEPVKENKCLFLTLEGEMPFIEIMTARYAATGLLASKLWDKVVVKIADLHLKLTTMELIDLASDLSSDLPTGARVALVVRPEQEPDAKLVERVARSEGVRLTCFFDMEKAKAWVGDATKDEQIHYWLAGKSL